MNVPENNLNHCEEWVFPPPPTLYDHIRDNVLTRGCRLLAHLVYRFSMHYYHHLHVLGAEQVPVDMPCLITPNHSSHLDTLAIFASLPVSQVNTTFSLAAKDYFFSNRLRALAARILVNGIPMDRSGKDIQGFRHAARKLKDGCRLIIYPEGTRSHTGEIGEFKPGVIALSRIATVPIVPAYIHGTFASLPKKSVFPKGKAITVVFGAPLYPWKSGWTDTPHTTVSRELQHRVRILKTHVSGGT